MINGKIFALEVNLFAHSEKSFVQALSAENIDCSEVMKFSTGPQMSAGKEKLIALLAETMPWNAVAKVITAWINAKSSSRLLKFLFASPTEAFKPKKSRLSACFLSDFSAGSRIIHPVSGHQTD
jgi:hypothetical protein